MRNVAVRTLALWLIALFMRLWSREYAALQPRIMCVQEIPTFHAKPLHPDCDNWCPFPVADRPNAVRQFFEAAAKDPSLIQAPWILLIETDYVWMRPLQKVPTAESSANSWAFQYGYIMPTYPCEPRHMPRVLALIYGIQQHAAMRC